jgi:hypothetical protein
VVQPSVILHFSSFTSNIQAIKKYQAKYVLSVTPHIIRLSNSQLFDLTIQHGRDRRGNHSEQGLKRTYIYTLHNKNLIATKLIRKPVSIHDCGNIMLFQQQQT